MNYGENIKRIRLRHELTQLEFGRRLGVTQVYVANLENGHKLPSRELILLIARIFNTTTDEVYFGTAS